MTDITLRDVLTGAVTKQQIFDFACTKLIKQGHGSYALDAGDAGMCLYRHPAGLKCAIGHLIPDSEYVSSMDGPVFEDSGTEDSGTGVVDLIDNFYPGENNIGHNLLSFLDQLQKSHDQAAINTIGHPEKFTDLFKKHARALAHEFKLDPTVVAVYNK